MKNVKIIYNPVSGMNFFSNPIFDLSNILLTRGHTVNRFATTGYKSAYYEAKKACQENWDVIIVSGGDGTVNEVINGIMKSERKIPIAIFKGGTVNDFANYMGLSDNPEVFANSIDQWYLEAIDLGFVNGKYFINVVAGGFLTSVPHKTKREVKQVLGRNAYYIEGLREFFNSGTPYFRMAFSCDEMSFEDDVHMFIISNTKSIGSFNNMAPEAEIHDGLLDVLVIKKTPFIEATEMFLQTFSGKHVDNKNVLYFQTKKIFVESLRDEVEFDVDGDFGGHLPASISVVPSAIQMVR